MKPVLFSNILIETRKRLELSREAMAFILGMKIQIYTLYEKGRFDDTYSRRKDFILGQLNNIDTLIQGKIELLERAIRLSRQASKITVRKAVKYTL